MSKSAKNIPVCEEKKIIICKQMEKEKKNKKKNIATRLENIDVCYSTVKSKMPGTPNEKKKHKIKIKIFLSMEIEKCI